MTREDLYRSIYTNDTIYRPPQEEGTALLEVTMGCSWAKCAFCDFSRDPYHVIAFEQVEERLKILSQLEPRAKRVFFLAENAFSLETGKLAALMELTRRYMPRVEEFSMYARADDVLHKSTLELKTLYRLGLTDLYLGLESGSDSILLQVNKGVTATQIAEAMRCMDQAGIQYSFTIILGLGGRTYRNLHAVETARLLNRGNPKCIWALALKIWPGTALDRDVRQGMSDCMTPRELLFEERILLENLMVQDCFYMDTTALNTYTIQGYLQAGKQSLLDMVEMLLIQSKDEEIQGGTT